MTRKCIICSEYCEGAFCSEDCYVERVRQTDPYLYKEIIKDRKEYFKFQICGPL